MTGGPLPAYRALLDSGELTPDPAQCLAAEKLQSLHNALKGYEPALAGSWKARFGLTRRTEEPPMGLYIYGDVGRGKSMLMDLFFESAPVEKKRRVHFHEFMLELHDTLHVWRRDGRADGKEGKHVDDLLPAFAETVAADAWVLCFDEFHVNNIADAMLLGRLFQALFDLGVIVISTSNWPPGDLYKDGLQRELFEPFIVLIKETLDVLELTARRDYRLARLMSMKVYHLPVGPKAERALASAFTHLTDGAAGAPSSLAVKGRTVPVPRAAKGVACFTFAGLCGQPLGAADYIAIAGAFHTVILSGVPRLRPAQRNEAKRFATLVDALYERTVKLIVSADAAPQDLYREGTGTFDFRRTVSRLMEMQSAEYLEQRREAGKADAA